MSDEPAGVDEQKVIDDAAQPATDGKAENEEQRAFTDFNRRDTKASMRVLVHSPFRNYYDGLAFSLSAESATGPFDILPHHHNFISLLVPCDIVVRTVKEGARRIRISGGIIHVKADQIIVFLDV